MTAPRHPLDLCETCDGTGTVAEEALSADGVCPVCDGSGWLADAPAAQVPLYRLVGTRPVPEPDRRAWAQWFETADRLVARTAVGPGVAVETVFLGRDQAWNALAPLLFESRVYGGRLDGERLLYATWGAAAQGHAVQVARCQQALGEAAP